MLLPRVGKRLDQSGVKVRGPVMLHLVEKGSPECAEALERGRIVQFVRCPVELPAAEDQEFLREGLGPFLRRKNVSWYPRAGKLTGLQAPARVVARATRV